MKNLLNTITQPEDIHEFTTEELMQLAQDCRERIIQVTSQNGGHLASSLGSVEITVALFKLFDFSSDRIVWDVGHQAYTHKLLTGRNQTFDTLAQKDGIKKYLSLNESDFDHFGAGHASTSISAALGMATGRDLTEQDNHVIAVIGDGAMTGGLAFEALNHNGYLGKKLIVIFNDNGMSIDPNVGALSKAFTRLMASRSYNKLRDETWELTGKVPFSDTIRAGLHKINASIKTFMTPGAMFEQLGWRYFGPIDGHSIPELLDLLGHVKELDAPIVIHALTQKGKGYSFAEDDAYKYHGVSPFVPDSGEFIKKQPVTKAQSYSAVFGGQLGKLMERDKTVVGISAAMMSGTGIIKLAKKYPDRIFDVGIAEGHAVTSAAGMATAGLKPFVAIYSTFLQRAIDHIIHDVAIQHLPVRFMLDRAGLVGADGPTHQGVYDLSYLRMIPGMVVMAPSNGSELQAMVELAYQIEDCPSAVRYPRGNTSQYDQPLATPLELGKAEIVEDGNEIAIFAAGITLDAAKKAAEELGKQGYSVAVINARFVKPIDSEAVRYFAQKVSLVVTVEENTIHGGFGSGVLEELSALDFTPSTLLLGVPDRFIAQGKPEEQREDCGIGPEQVLKAIQRKLDSIPGLRKQVRSAS